MSPARHRLLPTGPGSPGGARSPAGYTCPPFSSDPAGWLAWVDDALASGAPLDEAVRPGSWRDSRGCEWRVLASHDGPEIRPAFGSACMLARGMPVISALRITPDRILVELTWRDGQEVVQAMPRQIACRDLGLAMLTGIELPHEAVTRLGPDTWQRARDRWEELLATPPDQGRPQPGTKENHAHAPSPVRAP